MILPSVVLPAPLGPTMARRSPGRDVEVDAVEHERPGVVAEHHVVDVHADRGGRTRGRLRHLPFGAVGGKLGDPDEAGERRGRALHLVGLLEQGGNGVEELHEVQRRRAQRADLDGAVVDERGTRGHDRDQRHGLRQADARAHAVPRRGRGHLGVDGDPTAASESAAGAGTGAEPRQHRGALIRLVQPRAERGVALPFAPVQGVGTAEVPLSRRQRDRDRGDERDRGEAQVEHQQGDHGERDLQHREEHDRDGIAHRVGEDRDVAGDAAHEVAGARALDEVDRHRERVVEHLFAHLGEGVLTDDRRPHPAEVPEDGGDDRQHRVGERARSTVCRASGESFATASTTTPTRAGPASVAMVDALCSSTVIVTPRHRSRSSRSMRVRAALGVAVGSAWSSVPVVVVTTSVMAPRDPGSADRGATRRADPVTRPARCRRPPRGRTARARVR